MKRKVALISSIAYRPQLLVLDEPFSALDPLIKEEFISAILEITESEHWTIFISTHDIEEAEKLADRVGIINKGKLVVNEDVESLQQRFRRVEVVLSPPISQPIAQRDEWYGFEVQDRVIRFVEAQYSPDESENLYRKIFGSKAEIQTQGLTLREIFLAIAQQFQIKGL